MMIKDFVTGFSYNALGIKFFVSHKKLWIYTLIPLAINFLALIVLVSLYLHFFNDLFSYITGPLGHLDIVEPQNFLFKIFDLGLWVVRNLFMVLFFILSLVFIFISVFLLSSVINSPFYEMMAEKILIEKGLIEDVSFSLKRFAGELKHSLKIEMYKVVFFVSISFLLFVLGWVPVLGPFFSLLGIFFAAWVFAFGLCSYPLVLKRTSFQDILKWARSRKMMLIGFGLPSLIPFVGLILMSFQVCGGTLLFVENSDLTSKKG